MHTLKRMPLVFQRTSIYSKRHFWTFRLHLCFNQPLQHLSKDVITLKNVLVITFENNNGPRSSKHGMMFYYYLLRYHYVPDTRICNRVSYIKPTLYISIYEQQKPNGTSPNCLKCKKLKRIHTTVSGEKMQQFWQAVRTVQRSVELLDSI